MNESEYRMNSNSSAMMYSARCFRCFLRKSRVVRRETAFFAVSVHHLLRFSRRLNCNNEYEKSVEGEKMIGESKAAGKCGTGEVLRYVFPKTVPVMVGYIFLGTAYGILMSVNGFSAGWALAISVIVYLSLIHISEPTRH